MARIRSVKPELRTSEVVASWPREVRYAFVLLWGYLDDKGRGLDVPKAIAGDCFPHDDDVTPSKMDKWLKLMATTKLAEHHEPPICRYEVAGRKYLHCLNWDEHQRPNRPSPSRLPPCPLHEPLNEPLNEPLSESGSEGGGDNSLSDSLRARKGAGEQGSRGDGAGEQGSSKARDVSRSRRRGAATGEPPPDAGPPGAAERIVGDWIATLPKQPQGRIVNAIGIIVQAALGEGQDPNDVAEGLRRWQAKGRLGPAALPSFIHEAATAPSSTPNGQRQVGNFVLKDTTVADLERVRRMAELDAADTNGRTTIEGMPA